jgi:hypothetical protein
MVEVSTVFATSQSELLLMVSKSGISADTTVMSSRRQAIPRMPFPQIISHTPGKNTYTFEYIKLFLIKKTINAIFFT